MAWKKQTQEGLHSGRSLIPEQVPGGPDGSTDIACRPPRCDNPSRLQLSWRITVERGRRKKLPIRELFYGPSFELTQFTVPLNSILIRGTRKEIFASHHSEPLRLVSPIRKSAIAAAPLGIPPSDVL